MTKVFVYGTLKRGKSRQGSMKGAAFLQEVRTMARYTLFQAANDDYPCLVEDENQGVSVEGELWEVPDHCLEELDRIEGVPDWFQRRIITLEDGQEVHAYLMAEKPALARRLGNRWE